MKRVQHEKLKVLRPCIKLCKQWREDGTILGWSRPDVLDTYFETGDSDLRIEYAVGDVLHLLLAEMKRPDGKGKQRTSQKKYENRYSNLINVEYVIFESVEDFKAHVRRVTGAYEREKNIIESISF